MKKRKAIEIVSIPRDVGHDFPEPEDVLGVGHSYGFGPGGEFTACDIDLSDCLIFVKEVSRVTCPKCKEQMQSLRHQLANWRTY